MKTFEEIIVIILGIMIGFSIALAMVGESKICKSSRGINVYFSSGSCEYLILDK